jgi:hypothetical protein
MRNCIVVRIGVIVNVMNAIYIFGLKYLQPLLLVVNFLCLLLVSSSHIVVLDVFLTCRP